MTPPETNTIALIPDREQRLAIIIPCYNEALTVAQVVQDYSKAAPKADIIVFDNNSTDNTAEIATAAGAIVIHSPRQGKGNVLRHAFESVDADVFILTDGDDTYPASALDTLLEPVLNEGVDMVVGTRLKEHKSDAFRRFHKLGNYVITSLVSLLFGQRISDVLSGYRILSRRFAKDVYLRCGGFEVETELTLQAISMGATLREIPVPYGERPPGSQSKLSTFKDGARIMRAILLIFKDYKPLVFFGALGATAIILGLGFGLVPITDYVLFAYVYHLPLAVLAASLMILGTLLCGIGLILDTIKNLHFEERARLRSLQNEIERLRKK